MNEIPDPRTSPRPASGAETGAATRAPEAHDGPDALAGDRAGVLRALDRIRAAWDAGDATPFAAEFTEDASYVIFVGLHYVGREAIRRSHVPVFEKWQRGSRMSMRVLDLRFPTPDVAIALTEGGIGKRARIRHDKVQTFVLVRDGAEWRCAAFQNTRKQRLFMAINRLADPDSR
jgi:uncharacterized protein (TIGR02246 family)